MLGGGLRARKAGGWTGARPIGALCLVHVIDFDKALELCGIEVLALALLLVRAARKDHGWPLRCLCLMQAVGRQGHPACTPAAPRIQLPEPCTGAAQCSSTRASQPRRDRLPSAPDLQQSLLASIAGAQEEGQVVGLRAHLVPSWAWRSVLMRAAAWSQAPAHLAAARDHHHTNL
jgi:hypothetical protein